MIFEIVFDNEQYTLIFRTNFNHFTRKILKRLPVKVRTTPDAVVGEMFGVLLVSKVLQRIRPE